MALMVFLQEDEDVPSVYRNLKFFCGTAPLCNITGSRGPNEWFLQCCRTITTNRHRRRHRHAIVISVVYTRSSTPQSPALSLRPNE